MSSANVHGGKKTISGAAKRSTTSAASPVPVAPTTGPDYKTLIREQREAELELKRQKVAEERAANAERLRLLKDSRFQGPKRLHNISVYSGTVLENSVPNREKSNAERIKMQREHDLEVRRAKATAIREGDRARREALEKRRVECTRRYREDREKSLERLKNFKEEQSATLFLNKTISANCKVAPKVDSKIKNDRIASQLKGHVNRASLLIKPEQKMVKKNRSATSTNSEVVTFPAINGTVAGIKENELENKEPEPVFYKQEKTFSLPKEDFVNVQITQNLPSSERDAALFTHIMENTGETVAEEGDTELKKTENREGQKELVVEVFQECTEEQLKQQSKEGSVWPLTKENSVRDLNTDNEKEKSNEKRISDDVHALSVERPYRG